MSSLTKRKKQLLSIVLCVCMIMTGIMVERKEVRAETYCFDENCSTGNILTKHDEGEYEPYYEYGTGENAKKVFTSGDSIQYNDATPIVNLYKEGVRQDSTSLPEGEWLISEVNDGGGYSVSIVSATAETKVYLCAEDGNYVLADVGAAGEDGMAPVTFPEREGDGYDETREFYEDLNIQVRKSVDKLDPESFKISITDKNTNVDRTGEFLYCPQESVAEGQWNWFDFDKWEHMSYLTPSDSGGSTRALGGILSDNVRIYIYPSYKMLLLKALAGEGGSISPGNEYYQVNDCGEKKYTITASEGYVIRDVKKSYPFNSEGTSIMPAGVTSECSVSFTPEEICYPAKRVNVMKLEASFNKKNYSVTFGGIGANGGVYKAYSSSGETTVYTKHIAGQEASLTGSVAYEEDSDVYYFKADNEKYKVVLKDNDVVQALGSPNEDGYYQYQLKGVDKEHQLAVSFNETTIVNKATDGYQTEYVYNGKPLPVPTENNFSINSVDKSAKDNKPKVTFEWYKGETVGDGSKLTGAPSDVGTYTLKVSVAETEEYFASSKNFTIKINKFEPGEIQATLEGEKVNGWYTGDVTLKAPAGYEISTNQTGGSWRDSLTITEDINGDYTYFLKQKETGYVTEAKTITIMRDTVAPGGSGNGNGSGIGSQSGNGNEIGSQSESSKTQWDAINDKISDAINKGGDGAAITIDMNGATTVPADIFADIKGKDITVVLDLGNGIKWKVDGKDVTNVPNGQIDFGVQTGTNSISGDIINTITGERYSMQISLNHDGEFGFKAVLTINLEKKNTGYYANLFYYNEQTKELEFMTYGKINADGNVDLDFNHASDYVIVIDDKPLDDSKDAETGTAVSTQDHSVELDKKAFVALKDKKLSLTWGKVEGADGYDIFAAQCGKESLAKALAVTVKGQKTSVDLEKVSGKKISDKISYKVRIKAYKLVDGKKTYIGSSLVYYTVGKKNKTYTNVKMVKITKTSVTLNTGKTKKVKAAIEKQSPKKKLLTKGNDLRYFSMNKRIATVTENGKIEAKKKGTCFVYVTALNGKKAKVKVTVK